MKRILICVFVALAAAMPGIGRAEQDATAQKEKKEASAVNSGSDRVIQEEFVKQQIADIRQELEGVESFKSVAVKPGSIGEKGISIDIIFREGRSFLFFRGKKYVLSLIDEDGDGELDRASFRFSDNTDRDETVTVKKDFHRPFPEEMGQELDRLYGRFKPDSEKKYSRFSDFSPKGLYEKYIKKPIIDRLK